MKLSIETIRDTEEPDEPEEANDRTAEEYHLSILTALQPGRQLSIY